jgi:hypothetical protein
VPLKPLDNVFMAIGVGGGPGIVPLSVARSKRPRNWDPRRFSTGEAFERLDRFARAFHSAIGGAVVGDGLDHPQTRVADGRSFRASEALRRRRAGPETVCGDPWRSLPRDLEDSSGTLGPTRDG